MRLISMTNYVIKTYDEVVDSLDSELMMVNYANFLKQPLNLKLDFLIKKIRNIKIKDYYFEIITFYVPLKI